MASPLTDLSISQVAEMSRIGLQAVSLDRESVKRLRAQNINVFQRVRDCEWSMFLALPERLTAPEFDTIVRDETFQSNITLYIVDEAHVLRPWSLTFRQCYDDIPQIRLRIPLRVPILALTATLLPGPTETTLLRTLRCRPGHCITRRSSNHHNRRIMYQTLSHGLDGLEFPDLAWFAAGKYKFILYCKTIELRFRVISYLWRLLPPGCSRRHKIRFYNSLIPLEVNEAIVKAIDDDPEVLGVVATIKFGMGIDVRRVVFVGIVGLAESVEQDKQEGGRSVRDPAINGGSISYVERSVVNTISKELEDGKVTGYASDSEVETTRGQRAQEIRTHQTAVRTNDDTQIALDTRQHGKTRRLIDPGLRRLIVAHIQHRCLVATSNNIFGDIYDGSDLSCFEAKRPLPCSSCLVCFPQFATCSVIPSGILPRKPIPPTMTDLMPLPDDDDDDLSLLSTSHHRILTKAMRVIASTAIDTFSRSRWILKLGLWYRHVPYTAHIPSSMRREIFDKFHLIRDREALAGILADWEFIEEDLHPLFQCIKKLNDQFDRDHIKTRKVRTLKAAETRRRTKDSLERPHAVLKEKRVNEAGSKRNLQEW
ncbi:hypothetical protein QCA50_012636 [Cerrena zonata]|uniref:DNA 3'-5' helicase n=1 Tax=Cerrena zonata TaxID=2478898 RepID=A0AAW0G425_9APHY